MSGKLFIALFSAIFVLIAPPSFANHPVNVNDKVQVEIGKKIYQENCASCHGMNRQGPENPKDFGKRKPPRLDAKGHGFHHGDQTHFGQIVKGSRDKAGKPIDDGMPPFGEVLSKQEIWATIAYIKSHWPHAMRMKQDMMNPGHNPGRNPSQKMEMKSGAGHHGANGMPPHMKQKQHGN